VASFNGHDSKDPAMDPSVKDALESMKLTGASNYIIWIYKVKMNLMQEGL